MGISVIGGSSAGGAKQVIRRITATQTWTAPADVSAVEVTLVGGGGSGGPALGVYYGAAAWMAGGGGSGGQIIKNVVSVTPGSTYTVTIGAGGSGQTNAQGNNSNSQGSPGGSSSFGNLLIAKGGGGATAGNVVPSSSNSTYSEQSVVAMQHIMQDSWGLGGQGSNARASTSNNISAPAWPGPGARTGLFISDSEAYRPADANLYLSGSTVGIAHHNGGFVGYGLYHNATTAIAGRGENGMAGGGGAGVIAPGAAGVDPRNTTDSSHRFIIWRSTFGVDGGGNSRYVASSGGAYYGEVNSGAANTGAGGGGSVGAKSNWQVNAGSGGSGVCIIKYTTALEA